ncbi:Conserved_hypothetical protein [Hexamita inflata]|uniref:Uncharacterized protein n=1 Tax=Hexamita inflata TaxID=28002 RepID=A0AA86RS14_9EUKA|nr:Conserved hypothetical protein [Hexamita inflata]
MSLRSLSLTQLFNLRKLEIHNCTNVIPVLKSNSIQTLIIQNCGIASADLYLENLEVLSLCHNELLQIKLNCPKLKDLNVSYNKNILSIWQLSENKSLTKLQCQDGHTLSGLQTMINLQFLDMSKNLRVDISQISHLTHLTQLGLFGCKLKNIEGLQSLTLLIELYMSSNIGLDISPIKQLVNLQKLHLSCCQFSNTQHLQYLTNLEELDLSFNENIDISTVKYLVKLKHIDLNGCKLKDVATLSTLTNLNTIMLQSSLIRDFMCLKQLVNWKTLQNSNNVVVNIAQLQNYSHIKWLYLDSCNIFEISALRSLNSLLTLDLSTNNIVSLGPLKNLKQLTDLNVENNYVSDFHPIEQHPNFELYQIENQNQASLQIIKLDDNMQLIDNAIIQLRKTQFNRRIWIDTKSVILQMTIFQHIQLLQQQHQAFMNKCCFYFNILNSLENFQ